jgi:hypothetical protein
MRFKHPGLSHELETADPRLREMAKVFEMIFREETGQEPLITRVKEHIKGSSEVHPAGRAFDVRDETSEGLDTVSDEQVLKICKRMNLIFFRRDGKLACIHHAFGDGPRHFHVQAERI